MAKAQTSQYRYPMELANRAAQLSSLLMLTFGGGKDWFNSLDEDDRDNILWLASDLANEVHAIVNHARDTEPPEARS